jgi:O-acetylhomoserine (thiol)-lyase
VVVEAGGFDWGRNGKFPSMSQPDPAYHGLTFAETFGDFAFTMKTRAVGLRDYGPTLSAQAAWNLLQGVETLPLRMERHCSNAQAVAEWLEKHPKIDWVSYPGLTSIHPASTTHRQLTPEQLQGAGVGPDVVRLSIGIESIDDIIADLEQSLAQV